ncbi:hypothetical protein M378DRAFT_10491 [Amanita muscaria Koide BX008]|uniref:Uncharacterized protein n=1 Tax=Amanita muscaria (strain Koide BX008) TaxID=946122 RepID=A0A0C2XAN9_AMAMK|nr:hypothetical protein M378DRAFT_10491 [Amanita muscaria Koide BX008]
MSPRPLLRSPCACKRLRRLPNHGRFLGTHASSVAVNGQILTLAYKIKKLVSQVLPPTGSGTQFTESAEFWEDILTNAHNDYASTPERPARVVVCGTDQWSPSEDLVTALLSDPLASDDPVNDVLSNRHRAIGTPLTISYATNPTNNGNSIQIPSNYLRQFPTAIQLTEVKSGDNLKTLSEDDLLLLFKADFPIVVVNPITTSLVDLLRIRLPSNTVLVQAAHPIKPSDRPHPLLASESARVQEIIFMDPSRAVQALKTLHGDPISSSVIQRYQDDFLGSGVSSITHALHRALGVPSEPPLATFRATVLLAHLRGALNASQDMINSATANVASISTNVDSLSRQVEEARRHATAEILGLGQAKAAKWGRVWPPIIRFGQDDLPRVIEAPVQETEGIAEAMMQSNRQMRGIMDNLTWWRVLWRVDEVSGLVHAAVERTWCPELEKKLVMHAGSLTSLQQDFNVQTFSMLDKTKAKLPYDYALLRNSMQQMSTSPSFALTPSTLVEPLHKRKSQLYKYPTTHLHLGAQRTFVGMSAGITSSAAFSWVGWAGWLSGAGLNVGTDNALLQALSSTMNFGIEPTTAVGLGAFGALASLRWAIGKWERAKKRWWEDWIRIGHGLERDLKATLEDVMREKVTVVAENGCVALRETTDKRKDEIAQFATELYALQAEQEIIEKQIRFKS